MPIKYLLFMLLLSNTTAFAQTFDIQGHRGCRGLMPENTIEAMLHAIDLGVTTLELDVVISADKQVLLSHEPFLSSEICLDKNGKPISPKNEKKFNIYQLNYSDIKQCDCGSKQHKRFPNQTKIKTYKPLLSELIDTVEAYLSQKYPQKQKTIFYNIETKCTAATDNIFHPKPDQFVDLLMEVIEKKGVEDRVLIQSFDVRSLQYLHPKYPTIKTVLLVQNISTITKNLQLLGFLPYAYSPYYPLVTHKMVNYLHEKGVKIIPWTVNETADMQHLIDLKVDGLITDYPNRYFDWLKDSITNIDTKTLVKVTCNPKNGDTFVQKTKNNSQTITFNSPAGYGKATFECEQVSKDLDCTWNFDKLEGFTLYLNQTESISFFEYEGKMKKDIKQDAPKTNNLLENVTIEIVKNKNAGKKKNNYILHLPKSFLTQYKQFSVQWIDYYR